MSWHSVVVFSHISLLPLPHTRSQKLWTTATIRSLGPFEKLELVGLNCSRRCPNKANVLGNFTFFIHCLLYLNYFLYFNFFISVVILSGIEVRDSLTRQYFSVTKFFPLFLSLHVVQFTTISVYRNFEDCITIR